MTPPKCTPSATQSAYVEPKCGPSVSPWLAATKAKEEATHVHRDGPRDNRNLYLAAEGQVHEGTAAENGVSQSDIMKRRRAKEEQTLKLKVSPC